MAASRAVTRALAGLAALQQVLPKAYGGSAELCPVLEAAQRMPVRQQAADTGVTVSDLPAVEILKLADGEPAITVTASAVVPAA
jgi:hypothetical protein